MNAQRSALTAAMACVRVSPYRQINPERTQTQESAIQNNDF